MNIANLIKKDIKRNQDVNIKVKLKEYTNFDEYTLTITDMCIAKFVNNTRLRAKIMKSIKYYKSKKPFKIIYIFNSRLFYGESISRKSVYTK